MIREAMQNGEMNQVIDLLKSSHDNQVDGFKAGRLLEGRSFKKDKTLDEVGSLPKYRDLGHFIEVMDKRYQENGTLD